ncbi:MAG: tRNA (adenosine(37)-N6)-threonylcarbamoyltransferase complex dimerization subunit type 1 TsaB [Coriobacteriia bacterium]
MKLTAVFDTATEQLAIAVGRLPEPGEPGDVEILAESDRMAPRAALSNLLPGLRDLLAEAGLTPADLECVVVGRGPGSFTGVRIGVATAKGLAHGLGVPLYGVGTLDAVARGLAGNGGMLGIVGDAMRGEVYPALFRLEGGDVRRIGVDLVERPLETASRWAAETDGAMLLAGDGLAKHEAVFREALAGRVEVVDRERWYPTGRALLAEAHARGVVAGEGEPGALLPIYTRLADAEEREPSRQASRERPPQSGVAGPGAVGP